MTEKITTVEVEDALAEKMAQRGKELTAQLTNKDKREAVKYFDSSWDEMDAMDQLVLLAYVADKSRSLETYDSMPLEEVQKVIAGE